MDPDKHGYSSAKGASMLHQLSHLVRYKLANRDRFAAVHFEDFMRIRAVLEREWGEQARGKTILEIGCGQWRANVVLFAALGHKVIGIDPELPPSSLREQFAFVREHGIQRAAKSIASDALFRRGFVARLLKQLATERRELPPTLLRVAGEKLPLPDESVDAVISNNVFEHVANVPAVVKEMRRVLKPGGIAHVIIHPFAAFSGGHHLATIGHEGTLGRPLAIPAWDHLRKNLHPSGVYLNRLREADYRAAFEANLQTVEWHRRGPEGEQYLTPEIERELSHYTRRELLTGKLDYTGRRPAPVTRIVISAAPKTQTAVPAG